MRTVTIRENEAGQRLDKFLHKYMKGAPGSLFYKSMRKKNIVLNNKRCTGGERLVTGDEVKLFFSEETFLKLGAPVYDTASCGLYSDGAAAGSNTPTPSAFVSGADTTAGSCAGEFTDAFRKIGAVPVVYEDAHILAVNKPAGMLTQKAEKKDVSLNEWLIGYLLDGGKITPGELDTFRPSVCNRLDRNTGGLVLCGKTLAGSQFLSELLRERRVRKLYRLFVKGRPEGEMLLTGTLKKDAARNQAAVFQEEKSGGQVVSQTAGHSGPGGMEERLYNVKTGFTPLLTGFLKGVGTITYAQAELFTGKTHQIRAQLSAAGYPLIGDRKYGDAALNRSCYKYGVRNQLLHAHQVIFPEGLTGPFAALSGKEITAPLPELFLILKKEIGDET